jgi:hypothetical protein
VACTYQQHYSGCDASSENDMCSTTRESTKFAYGPGTRRNGQEEEEAERKKQKGILDENKNEIVLWDLPFKVQ